MKRLIPLILLAALGGAGVASALIFSTGGSSRGSRTATSAALPTPAGSTTNSTASGSSSSGTRRLASASGLSASQVYQQDSSGVVSIRARTAEGEDSGTGIVLNENGLILTNDHVIAGASSITVSPGKSSQSTRTATLVGEDANSDLALIKVSPSGLGLKPLKLASSSTVKVGDGVFAIGNPYGLDETLTQGIVSALDRTISAPDGASIEGAIQTDAALNPGNSGGPLLNLQGEVIGVNSQIASEAAQTEGSQPGSTGVGFAISSNTVAKVIKTIEAGGGTRGSSAETQRQGTRGGAEEGSTSSGGGSPYGEEAVSPYGAGGYGAVGSGSGYGAEEPSASAAEAREAEGTAGGGRVVIVP